MKLYWKQIHAISFGYRIKSDSIVNIVYFKSTMKTSIKYFNLKLFRTSMMRLIRDRVLIHSPVSCATHPKCLFNRNRSRSSCHNLKIPRQEILRLWKKSDHVSIDFYDQNCISPGTYF